MIEKKKFAYETSEQLAKEIISFCKKWGMWQDVAIYTGGKCYTDAPENYRYDGIRGVIVKEEMHPEECTGGLLNGVDGECEWKSFSNPEHFLDMNFDGPLCQLLRHGEYEVKTEKLSEEAKKYICQNDEEILDNAYLNAMDYLENKEGLDSTEFDSYEEYLELAGDLGPDIDKYIFNDSTKEVALKEFVSREEYLDFLEKAVTCKEAELTEWFADEGYMLENKDTYFDAGHIANHILEEFNLILEKYGLYYELGFLWSLTAYRIE